MFNDVTNAALDSSAPPCREPRPAAPGGGLLPDIQATRDHRRIAIDRVGVSRVRHPVSIRAVDGSLQPTVATLGMFVSLPAERKGTHMSRFLEVLHERAGDLSPSALRDFAEHLRERLDALESFVEAEFTYFIPKSAPVTGQIGLMDYEVGLSCRAGPDGADTRLKVAASGTSLCPCSKEISAYGAHNQRCRVAAEVRFEGDLAIEELAAMLESACSAEVYSVLKRPDEKFVTEQAYERPKFVEDLIRDLAVALDADERITWYRISSENFESIHSHNAYAEIEREK